MIVYTTHIKCILRERWNSCLMKFNGWHALYCVKVNFTITKFEPYPQKIIILKTLEIICIHEKVDINRNLKPSDFVLTLLQMICEGRYNHLCKHLNPSQYKDRLSWCRYLHLKMSQSSYHYHGNSYISKTVSIYHKDSRFYTADINNSYSCLKRQYLYLERRVN